MGKRTRAEDAVRGPVQGRAHARCLADRLHSAREVVGDSRDAPPQEQRVTVAVHGYLVARGHDLARERGPPHDLLADEEERGGRPPARELLENRGRSRRVRAVVEGDRNGLAIDPAVETQPIGN